MTNPRKSQLVTLCRRNEGPDLHEELCHPLMIRLDPMALFLLLMFIPFVIRQYAPLYVVRVECDSHPDTSVVGKKALRLIWDKQLVSIAMTRRMVARDIVQLVLLCP